MNTASLERAASRIAGEMQASFTDISGDQSVQVRLVNGEFSGAQRYDLRVVIVGARDLIPDFRKASSGYQPDVSTTNHRNSQDAGLLVRIKIRLRDADSLPSMLSVGTGSKF